MQVSITRLFHFAGFTALVGWILVVGKVVILPVVVAIMLTYVLVGATNGLRRMSRFGALPEWAAYVVALAIFALALTGISLVSVANLRDIAQSDLPYDETVLQLARPLLRLVGVTDAPTWETLRDLVLQRMDMAQLSIDVLSSAASAGGFVVLIITYVVFMVAERGPLLRKIDLVMPDSARRGAAVSVFRRINDQIVTYLSTKTLVNVVVGAISFVLMAILGIDNAVFWAFLIGLLNYIPYVGSIAGVGVVITYSAFAYGNVQFTILALVLLTTAQVYVGNWLEPRLMARSMNLSPIVVLVALVIWSSLWGVPGAIVAVPMTSIMMIVLAAFDGTRPVAVLASRDGDLY